MTDDKQDPSVVAWQYRYWYSSGEAGVWLNERRDDADDLLESGVLIREETRALSLTSDLTAMKAELEEARDTNRRLNRGNQAIERAAYRSGRRFAFRFYAKEFMELRRTLSIIGRMVERRYPDDAGVTTDKLVERYIAAATARAEAAEQERDELREALKPFGKCAAEMNENTKPDDWTAWGYNDADLTYGDFRRARAALSTPESSQ